jgi:hypothetical protein
MEHETDLGAGPYQPAASRMVGGRASASTVWRWLHDDAIKPWQVRSWIFPRDPDFAVKARRALDLDARVFDGKRLRPDEYVISADEETPTQ